MKIINRTIVTALIYSKDNKLLMGKKDPSSGGVYNDCWHLPGGKVEENETKIEALKREILEEVGLEIPSNSIQFVTDHDKGLAITTLSSGEKVKAKMQFNVYEIYLDKLSDETKLNLQDHEFAEVFWFDLSELSSVKMTPPSSRYFKKIGIIR